MITPQKQEHFNEIQIIIVLFCFALNSTEQTYSNTPITKHPSPIFIIPALAIRNR